MSAAKLGNFYTSSSRKKPSWAWIGWFILTFGLAIGAQFRWGKLPPFARFLSPFEGVWQITNQPYLQPGTYRIDGEAGPITIVLDDQLIPHIQALSVKDVFIGQGFITAQHRLWQMDFQNLAVAGRISEVVGEKAIEYDRFQRRFGMKEAARRSAAMMMANPKSREALLAYTIGINRAISSWDHRQLPFEFKLLDYKPELWKPENSALLLKKMAYNLSATNDDKAMSQILDRYGKSVVDHLFPDRLPGDEPIIPKGTAWNFIPLPIPQIPPSLGWEDTTDEAIPIQQTPKLEDDNEVDVGSNNWAIAGSRTKSGKPILANDPHLKMTLPATWYVCELQAPGYHCMGGTLPGAPGVVSGFNEQVAWGITNGYPDVLDYYKVAFKDKSKRFYWFEDQWKPTSRIAEEIKIRGSKSVWDTVIWTHLGPVVYGKQEKPFYDHVPTEHALRWIAHDASNELLAVLNLNQSTDLNSAQTAVNHFDCPAQNFVLADASGHIGLFSQSGKIPLRWKDQGKFLLKASDPQQGWNQYIPKDQLPHIIDPPQGFVSSANQNPTDSTYPYYLNWSFSAFERGKRINEVLGQSADWDLAKVQKLQNDNLNLWAKETLPEMLKMVRQSKEHQAKYNWAVNILTAWNFEHQTNEIGPTVFSQWFDRWMQLAWSDDFGAGMRLPDKHQAWFLSQLNPEASWFDLKNTKSKETSNDLMVMALQQACDTLQLKLGAFSKTNSSYQWGLFKATTVNHMLSLNGLGTGVLPMGGGKGIVNATASSEGQSWKLIVELTGKKPKALAIYPGGQSGNPSSRFYDNFVRPWQAGQMNPIGFMY